MPRLIDADAWDSELMSYGFGQAIIGRKIKYTVGEVRGALAKQPTVDAIEVVRCKDCKHLSVRSGALGVYKCAIHGDYPSGEYFCADGERKEEEADS